MGHYDSAYEYEQMYGRAPHQTELQKANSKIRDLESRIKELEKESKPGDHRTVDSYEQEIGLLKAEIEELRNASKGGVKFTVNGVEKEFELKIIANFLCLSEVDGPNILSLRENGKYYRCWAVYTDGYKLNGNGQIKQQKDSP